MPQLTLPLTKDTAMIGTPAIANIMILTITDISLPHTIWDGLMEVVSMISKVCLSFSPDIEAPVMTGITKLMIRSSASPTSGNSFPNIL